MNASSITSESNPLVEREIVQINDSVESSIVPVIKMEFDSSPLVNGQQRTLAAYRPNGHNEFISAKRSQMELDQDGKSEVTDARGFATEFGDVDSIPDVNVYQHKKTLAQGMMDLALFSANANQLRYVLETSSNHPYYYPSVVLISISLVFQVLVGCGLIWNATYNVKDDVQICIANKINNFTIIGIFLVTVINVFISAFGVATPAVL